MSKFKSKMFEEAYNNFMEMYQNEGYIIYDEVLDFIENGEGEHRMVPKTIERAVMKHIFMTATEDFLAKDVDLIDGIEFYNKVLSEVTE